MDAEVVFTTPWFSELAERYIDVLAVLPDVRVGLISQAPLDQLDSSRRSKLAAHWRVDDIGDAGQLLDAAASLARLQGSISRLISPHENIQVPVAEVRERLGIPGMGVATARNFRDKARMKDLFRQAAPLDA